MVKWLVAGELYLSIPVQIKGLVAPEQLVFWTKQSYTSTVNHTSISSGQLWSPLETVFHQHQDSNYFLSLLVFPSDHFLIFFFLFLVGKTNNNNKNLSKVVSIACGQNTFDKQSPGLFYQMSKK